MAATDANGKDLLNAVKEMPPEEFDAFLEAACRLRMPAPRSTLSAKETHLIERINRGLPLKLRERYEQLRKQLRRGRLPANEHEELLKMTHEAESRDAERAAALLELAKLRHVPVRVLMKQMGIEAQPING
ncbi:MAG TPA: hypothetical protein VKS79_12285 [Gemmataceae bacterium]|nr:hypothetical protein [Gemmataceae bacterium]